MSYPERALYADKMIPEGRLTHLCTRPFQVYSTDAFYLLYTFLQNLSCVFRSTRRHQLAFVLAKYRRVRSPNTWKTDLPQHFVLAAIFQNQEDRGLSGSQIHLCMNCFSHPCFAPKHQNQMQKIVPTFAI